MHETAGIAESPRAVEWKWREAVEEETMAPLRVQRKSASQLPAAAGRAPCCDPCRDPDSDALTWTPTTTWKSTRVPAHAASGTDPWEENPRMADRSDDPKAEDHLEDRQEEDHRDDHQAEDHQAEDHLADHQVVTPHTDRQERTSPRVPRD